MKLHDGGRVPNARRVRIFLAEKGITLPLVPVDLGKREHMTEAFAALNPSRRVPVLEFEDGLCLAESMAICRYFEELHPTPPLFGRDARDRAVVEMWNRRMEFEFYGPASAAFRHLHPAMTNHEVPQVREWGEVNKERTLAQLEVLDGLLATRPYIAGDAFTVADITALVTVDFLKPARVVVPETLTHLRRWHGEVSARPSAAA